MSERKYKCFARVLIICSIILLPILKANCQDTIKIRNPKNTIHLEGASLFYIGMYSVNYERTIFQAERVKINANAGFGGWYQTTISQWYKGYAIPLSLNFLTGSGKNHFETDLGIRCTVFSGTSDTEKVPFYPIINLGYRYQRPDGKGLLFRSYIGLSGIGIGIGKAF